MGDTTCDPFNGTAVPLISALVAFVVLHVKVELLPIAMDVGFALMAAVGEPVTTVTVVCADAVVPDDPVATKVYVVVAVGDTVCDPFTATELPLSFALTALLDDQVSVELAPEAIEVGFALMLAVGEPLEPTVTDVCADVDVPAELVATNVYVVVEVGETVCDPLTATGAPLRVALAALAVVHVSVELPPEAIEVGLAAMVAVVT